ncbi:MAG: hypothetical protein JWO38_927 [Gemmataceae bacterium]|nr:hypothetical protein [Gemmataceae bacterium]
MVASKSGVAIPRKVIAHRLGRADATGKFGKQIRELVLRGLLIEACGVITDDISKLPVGAPKGKVCTPG